MSKKTGSKTNTPTKKTGGNSKKSNRLKTASVVISAVILAVAVGAVVLLIFTGGMSKGTVELTPTVTPTQTETPTPEPTEVPESYDEVLARLQDEFDEAYGDAAYEIIIEEETYTVPVASSLSIDTKKLQSDYDAGIEEDLDSYIVFTSSIDIRKAVLEISKNLECDLVETSWTFEDGVLSVTLGVSGIGINVDEIVLTIANLIKEGQYSGTLEFSMEYVSPAELDLDEIAEAVCVSAQDAHFDYSGSSVVVVNEVYGTEIDFEELQALLEEAEEGDTVTIEAKTTYPSVTADSLGDPLFSYVITSYSVPDGGTVSQKTNQGLACAAVNGTIVLPGEVFSFNGVVGDTTADKGYVLDSAYSNGTRIQVYGGGECRVSSTLYAAILHSDLEVTLRSNHSSPVSYLPLGMDATVSYPYPDLQIRNNRQYPIKICMELSDGWVKAVIYGTKEAIDDLTVEVELDTIAEVDKDGKDIVDTYRLYYNSAGQLVQKVFMHRSTYKPLNESSSSTTTTTTPTPTKTPTPTPTETETPEPTETETPEPTETETPGPTETETPEPTETETPEPTQTETPGPTQTETPEPTETETPEPTQTETPEPTQTETPEPTQTKTPDSSG